MRVEVPGRLVRALGEGGAGGGSAGAGAGEWLERLPELAAEALSAFGLTAGRVVEPGGRSALVVLVRRADGTPAALKLAPPQAGPEAELAALAHWDGLGAVRLLGATADAGALLLERLRPEVSLRSLPETKALLEAAGAVRRLWVAPPEGPVFESVAGRTARQAAELRALPAEVLDPAVVEGAVAARDELTAVPGESYLLHGCFRQGKVLSGERLPWLAVGPDPVVGERAYDLARLARDRVEDLVAVSAGASAARRRVARLAGSLEVDPDRLRGWTLFRAVESAGRLLRAGRFREAEPLLEFASWL
jgi:streptomycin 6-kinase